MNNMINKILMTLALLITAVGGAWAKDDKPANPVISGETEFYDEVTVTITCATSDANIYYTLDGSDPTVDSGSSTEIEYKNAFTLTETTTVKAAAYTGSWSAIVEVTFTKQTGPKVTPGEAANTWTFTMPAYDVEIAPIYAPKAVFATDGNLVLTPTAVEGVFAESNDPIVTPGTVAMIGETENPQGIVMYAVTSTNEATAPALTAFSADVPTAKNITIGSEVLVWYYIKGADTPDGQTASAENTFNDSEIASIQVTVLSNKFDIQFKAANANTIEAGKATVKVGDADAEVKEGKLTGVKMDSKVTITAKEGYKFRKVEATKTVNMLYIEASNHKLYYMEGETWRQAINNHTDLNQGWQYGGMEVWFGNIVNVLKGNGAAVDPGSVIDPTKTYTL